MRRVCRGRVCPGSTTTSSAAAAVPGFVDADVGHGERQPDRRPRAHAGRCHAARLACPLGQECGAKECVGRCPDAPTRGVGKRIRSLEKRELVSRRPTPYDRRGVLVSMVPAVMAVTAGQAVLAGPAVTVVPVVLAAVGVPPARAERLSCRLTICGCQGSLAIPARSAPPVLTGEPGPLVPLGRLADTATQLKTPRTCRCGGSSI